MKILVLILKSLFDFFLYFFHFRTILFSIEIVSRMEEKLNFPHRIEIIVIRMSLLISSWLHKEWTARFQREPHIMAYINKKPICRLYMVWNNWMNTDSAIAPFPSTLTKSFSIVRGPNVVMSCSYRVRYMAHGLNRHGPNNNNNNMSIYVHFVSTL